MPDLRQKGEIMKEYSIQPNGIITAFIDGNPAKSVKPGDVEYIKMLRLANGERLTNGKQPINPTGERRTNILPCYGTATPEKHFAGTEICGSGFKIVFDGKTRVIVSDLSEEQKAMITDAGFFYNTTTKSYNKKMTWRAYRSALRLADLLNGTKSF